MSSLTKLLVTETHRRKVHEQKGKSKTPLVMNFQANPGLELVIVSNSKGEMLLTENKGGGVLTGFFPLSLEDEDIYMASMIDSLFVMGIERDWGSISYLERMGGEDLEDIARYFEEFGIEMSRIFCSPLGYRTLLETGSLNHPGRNESLGEMPSEGELEKWEIDHFMAGHIEKRPIHINKYLGPYIVFSSLPSFVGLMTRIDTHVSVVLHNYERGLVIVRIKTDDE